MQVKKNPSLYTDVGQIVLANPHLNFYQLRPSLSISNVPRLINATSLGTMAGRWKGVGTQDSYQVGDSVLYVWIQDTIHDQLANQAFILGKCSPDHTFTATSLNTMFNGLNIWNCGLYDVQLTQLQRTPYMYDFNSNGFGDIFAGDWSVHGKQTGILVSDEYMGMRSGMASIKLDAFSRRIAETSLLRSVNTIGSEEDVKLYNDKYRDRHLLPTEGHRYMPYIVVVIDEYADLIMTSGMGGNAKNTAKSITTSIIRLAQKGRAAGIHVIIATQRPSVDVITGLIKTNFPTRIAFRVSTRVDSSTIIDSPGADKLIGKGDMLYYSGIDTERVQCALISLKEIREVTKFIADQTGYRKSYNTPYYLPPVNDADEQSGGGMVDMQNIDSMFEEAAKLVVISQMGSTSALQRKLGLGYARAGKIMDQLEAAGIVGPQEGSKPRSVLIQDLAGLEPVLKSFIG